MKISKSLISLIFLCSFFTSINAQNVSINVATQNAGIVQKGKLIFFEIVINNTSSIKIVPAYKLRPQITFPITIISVQKTGHVLPKGWGITSNTKGVFTLTNGTDVIGQNEKRSILISIEGLVLGGPSIIMGNLLFSNGTSAGFSPGISLTDDFLADNVSSSTVKVVE